MMWFFCMFISQWQWKYNLSISTETIHQEQILILHNEINRIWINPRPKKLTRKWKWEKSQEEQERSESFSRKDRLAIDVIFAEQTNKEYLAISNKACQSRAVCKNERQAGLASCPHTGVFARLFVNVFISSSAAKARESESSETTPTIAFYLMHWFEHTVAVLPLFSSIKHAFVRI